MFKNLIEKEVFRVLLEEESESQDRNDSDGRFVCFFEQLHHKLLHLWHSYNVVLTKCHHV